MEPHVGTQASLCAIQEYVSSSITSPESEYEFTLYVHYMESHVVNMCRHDINDMLAHSDISSIASE